MSKIRPISDLVPKLIEESLGKKSLLFGKLLSEWVHIAGEEIAAKALPIELKFAKKTNQKSQAVLHLAVRSGDALELSYQKQILVERLNVFFGYAAIKDIKIIQNSFIMNTKIPSSRKTRTLSPKETAEINEAVEEIQENDLQTALKNLGKAIISRQNDAT